VDANCESGESWQLVTAIAEGLTVCEVHKIMDAIILVKSGIKGGKIVHFWCGFFSVFFIEGFANCELLNKHRLGTLLCS
jgi:hypothetical protein